MARTCSRHGWLLMVASLSLAAGTAQAQQTLYVDQNGPGGNGLSWHTAMQKLRPALEQAMANPQITTIKVASGNYYPDEVERGRSFVIRPGLKVLCGYAGSQAPDPEQIIGVSTLSGNIGDTSTHLDNSYHVVRMDPDPRMSPSYIFRAVIEHGRADGRGDDSSGAGVFVNRANLNMIAVSLQSNYATGPGGGLYARGATVLLQGAETPVFTGGLVFNTGQHGGAVYAAGGSVAVKGYDCLKNGCTTTAGNGRDVAFVGTMGKGTGVWGMTDESHLGYPSASINKGGCVYIDAAPGSAPIEISRWGAIRNVFRNHDVRFGAGVWVERGTANISYTGFYGGAWYSDPSNNVAQGGGLGVNTGATANVSNCRFEQMVVVAPNRGSAIYVLPGGFLNMSNSAVWRIDIPDGFDPPAPAIEVDGTALITSSTIVKCATGGVSARGNVTMYNSIVWDNAAFNLDGNVSAKYSDVQGGWPGTGNVNIDPCLSSIDGGDLHILYTSPLVDIGETGGLDADRCDIDGDGNRTELVPIDLNSWDDLAKPRVFNNALDIGAYEAQRCVADFDNDGDVDQNDKDNFAFFFNLQNPICDVNCDGVVDQADYVKFMTHYQAGC